MEEKNLEKPTFKKICLMYMQQLTNFPYIEKDFDALTDYVLLCKVVDKLNEVVKNTNLQDEYIVNLYNAFVALKEYIDNYFKNLDVQEEINNKLDEMAASGELESIISKYVKLSVFIQTDVKEYYDETSQTKYYIVEIPKEDDTGGENKIQLGIPYDDTSLASSESTIYFAIDNVASVCINGGIGSSTNPQHPHGIVIQNGVVLKDDVYTTYTAEGLGIKEDGTFMSFDASNTTAQQLLNQGVVDALVGWGPIIVDGVSIQPVFANASETNPRQIICRKTNGDYLVFTCDGRLSNNVGMTISDVQRILQAYGNIDYAYCLDGGGSTSTVVDMQKINMDIDSHYIDRDVYTFLYFKKEPALDNPDIENIYGLLSLLRQQVIKNQATGEVTNGQIKLYASGTEPRIDFYENNNRNTRHGFIRLTNQGLTIQYRDGDDAELTNLLTATKLYLRYLGEPLGHFMNYCTNDPDTTDLNDITKAGIYLCNSNTLNRPRVGNYLVLHMNKNEDYNTKYQIAFYIGSTGNNYIFERTYTNNSWVDWKPINIGIGTTAGRPSTFLTAGMQFFDTTLGKPIWYDGTNWVDATGTQV